MVEIKTTVTALKTALLYWTWLNEDLWARGYIDTLSKEEISARGRNEKNPKSKKTKRKKNEKKKKNSTEYQGLWYTYNSCNIHIMGIPEGKKADKGTEEIFKTIMTENFPS